MRIISTYISLVIVILITLSLGFIFYIWFHSLMIRSSEETQKEIISSLECQKASIRIEEIINCSQNILNFSVRNTGKVDLKEFLVNIKFKDGKVTNYKDVFECFTEQRLELLSGEKKCAYILDDLNDLRNSFEISIVIKNCPNIYDSLPINC